MEVEVKRDNNTILLKDVKDGECFIFDDKLYMKTDMDSDTSSQIRRICVRMDNGSCELFNPVLNVQRVIISKVVVRTY